VAVVLGVLLERVTRERQAVLTQVVVAVEPTERQALAVPVLLLSVPLLVDQPLV
jgi:hypothetical protein